MRALVVALAVLAVAGAACGSGPTSAAQPGASPTAATAPPVTAAPPPSTGPTAAPQLDRCHTVGLALTAVTQPDGGAGNFVQEFGLINRGSGPCTVYGYPGMAMIDASGNQLPTHVVRDPGTRFPFVKLGTYTVQPGATAPFWVHWGQVPVGGETTCSTSAGIIVTPPDETTQLRLDGVRIMACNMGQLDVSPVAAPGTKAP